MAGDTCILADQQRLKQVFINIVSNAIKYNRPGGSITITSTVDTAERMRLRISDTGPGMTELQLSRMFQPFDRLGAEGTGIEGTGLGLALSKSLVEAMGGQIGVESSPGNGSTFWVEFPVAVALEARLAGERSVGPLASSEHYNVRSLLYIEDNLANVALLETVMALHPNIVLHKATHAADGLTQAVARRPDLILLDYDLPDLSGLEVLNRLRADPRTAAIPVIILSAGESPAQRQRLEMAGACDYLTKPLNVRHLLRAIDAVLISKAS